MLSKRSADNDYLSGNQQAIYLLKRDVKFYRLQKIVYCY